MNGSCSQVFKGEWGCASNSRLDSCNLVTEELATRALRSCAYLGHTPDRVEGRFTGSIQDAKCLQSDPNSIKQSVLQVVYAKDSSVHQMKLETVPTHPRHPASETTLRHGILCSVEYENIDWVGRTVRGSPRSTEAAPGTS